MEEKDEQYHTNKCLDAYGDKTCSDFYTCCDCGRIDGGCGCCYCWSCNACENCIEEE